MVKRFTISGSSNSARLQMVKRFTIDRPKSRAPAVSVETCRGLRRGAVPETCEKVAARVAGGKLARGGGT
jgi:hypothetical protein